MDILQEIILPSGCFRRSPSCWHAYQAITEAEDKESEEPYRHLPKFAKNDIRKCFSESFLKVFHSKMNKNLANNPLKGMNQANERGGHYYNT